jgi:hypothetical protein
VKSEKWVAEYLRLKGRKSLLQGPASEFVSPAAQIGTDSASRVVLTQVLEVPGCLRVADREPSRRHSKRKRVNQRFSPATRDERHLPADTQRGSSRSSPVRKSGPKSAKQRFGLKSNVESLTDLISNE